MGTPLHQKFYFTDKKSREDIFKLTYILVVSFFFLTSLSFAQLGTDTFVIASDDASIANYPGGTWSNASNGGNGFGNWSLSTTGGGAAGHYIGGTGQGTTSFGLFAEAFNNSNAFRDLNRDLLTDETISVDIGATSVNSGAELLIQLVNNGSIAFTVKFVGGQTNWLLNDGGSDFSSGEGFQTNTSINFSFTYEGGNNYSWSLGSNSGNNNTATNNVNGIDEIRFINQGQGSGNNFGFNNLEITSKYTIPSGQTSNVTANTTAPYLEVQSGGAVVVQAGNVLTVSGDITNAGTITFESDATGTAQLDEFTSTFSGSGEVTVERYIPAERAFRLLASPVTTSGTIFDNWQEGGIYPTSANNIGTHITGVPGTVGQFDAATGLDQTATGNPSMFTFDNAHIDPLSGTDQSGAWEAVTSTNQSGDNLNAEIPYLLFVRGDRSIDLSSNSSTPTNTTLSATGTLFTNSTSTQTLSSEPEYFSLVANPFQAIVNFNDLAFTGLGNSNFMYVYDPTQRDFETLETGVNDSEMFIRPGQSFFVVNTTGTATASTVEFEQADINTSPSPGPTTTVFNDSPLAKLELELYNGSNDLRETLTLRFEDNASNAVNEFDAPKLTGDSENLASVNSGNIYTIERRARVQGSDQIPLHLDQYQGENYEFRLNVEHWNPDVEVFVTDDYLGTTTEIKPNQAYTFSVDANLPESISENRFSLVFNNTTLGVDNNRFGENFSLYPNPTNGQFSTKTPHLSGKVNVEITNLLGQQVYAQKLDLESQKVTISTPNLSTGIYVVNLKQGHQSFSKKLIVE